MNGSEHSLRPARRGLRHDEEAYDGMYRNAELILPCDLLREIQKYVEGQEIYIPKRGQTRLGWGEMNGTRAFLAERNRSILTAYQCGASIDQLMAQYHLGYDSVRKILRKARRELQAV